MIKKYNFFIGPVVGGVLGWLLSGSFRTGLILFIALCIGEWMGKRKK